MIHIKKFALFMLMACLMVFSQLSTQAYNTTIPEKDSWYFAGHSNFNARVVNALDMIYLQGVPITNWTQLAGGPQSKFIYSGSTNYFGDIASHTVSEFQPVFTGLSYIIITNSPWARTNSVWDYTSITNPPWADTNLVYSVSNAYSNVWYTIQLASNAIPLSASYTFITNSPWAATNQQWSYVVITNNPWATTSMVYSVSNAYSNVWYTIQLVSNAIPISAAQIGGLTNALAFDVNGAALIVSNAYSNVWYTIQQLSNNIPLSASYTFITNSPWATTNQLWGYIVITNAPWALTNASWSYTSITNAPWLTSVPSLPYIIITNAPWATTTMVNAVSNSIPTNAAQIGGLTNALAFDSIGAAIVVSNAYSNVWYIIQLTSNAIPLSVSYTFITNSPWALTNSSWEYNSITNSPWIVNNSSNISLTFTNIIVPDATYNNNPVTLNQMNNAISAIVGDEYYQATNLVSIGGISGLNLSDNPVNNWQKNYSVAYPGGSSAYSTNVLSVWWYTNQSSAVSIQSGTYIEHEHISWTISGEQGTSANMWIVPELVYCPVGGNVTNIAATGPITPLFTTLGTVYEYVMSVHVDYPVNVGTNFYLGKRLKVIRQGGPNNAATVSLYGGGNNDSHLGTPTSIQGVGIVNTFNGRSNVVTPQSGDYTADMVGAISNNQIGVNLSLLTSSNTTIYGTISNLGNSVTGLILIGNTNSYFEANIQNTNTGTNVSSDWVATANNGNATNHFIDMGINGGSGGASPFTGTNDAYLYTTENNLRIAALGTNGVISFYTGTNTTLGMTITNGFVGIGTNNPQALLDVNGNAIFRGTNTFLGVVNLPSPLVFGALTVSNINVIGGTATNLTLNGITTNNGEVFVNGSTLTMKDGGGNIKASIDGATGNTVINGNLTVANDPCYGWQVVHAAYNFNQSSMGWYELGMATAASNTATKIGYIELGSVLSVSHIDIQGFTEFTSGGETTNSKAYFEFWETGIRPNGAAYQPGRLVYSFIHTWNSTNSNAGFSFTYTPTNIINCEQLAAYIYPANVGTNRAGGMEVHSISFRKRSW